jgi:hypothetical protein
VTCCNCEHTEFGVAMEPGWVMKRGRPGGRQVRLSWSSCSFADECEGAPRLRVRLALIDQPTTRREKGSITVAT